MNATTASSTSGCALTRGASLRASRGVLRGSKVPTTATRNKGNKRGGVAVQPVRAAASGDDAKGGGGFLLESIASPFISAKQTLNEGRDEGRGCWLGLARRRKSEKLTTPFNHSVFYGISDCCWTQNLSLSLNHLSAIHILSAST